MYSIYLVSETISYNAENTQNIHRVVNFICFQVLPVDRRLDN